MSSAYWMQLERQEKSCIRTNTTKCSHVRPHCSAATRYGGRRGTGPRTQQRPGHQSGSGRLPLQECCCVVSRQRHCLRHTPRLFPPKESHGYGPPAYRAPFGTKSPGGRETDWGGGERSRAGHGRAWQGRGFRGVKRRKKVKLAHTLPASVAASNSAD
jgi:hypothetical protein